MTSVLLACTAVAAPEGLRSIALDPAALGGAAVFAAAEDLLVRAAGEVGLAFVPDPKPLPPQVLLPWIPSDESQRREEEVFVWRGDMLPDQMAPAESGWLYRRERQDDGTWSRPPPAPAPSQPPPDFESFRRPVGAVHLPELILETGYRLGTAGAAGAVLVLWRTVEEGSAPIGGALVLHAPPPALAEALERLAPAFSDRPVWQAEFDLFLSY